MTAWWCGPESGVGPPDASMTDPNQHSLLRDLSGCFFGLQSRDYLRVLPDVDIEKVSRIGTPSGEDHLPLSLPLFSSPSRIRIESRLQMSRDITPRKPSSWLAALRQCIGIIARSHKQVGAGRGGDKMPCTTLNACCRDAGSRYNPGVESAQDGSCKEDFLSWLSMAGTTCESIRTHGDIQSCRGPASPNTHPSPLHLLTGGKAGIMQCASLHERGSQNSRNV